MAAPRADYVYELTPLARPNQPFEMKVAVTFKGSSAGDTQLGLAGSGQVTAQDFTVSSGSVTKTDRGVSIHHAPNAQVTLSYVVRLSGEALGSSKSIRSFAFGQDWFAGYAWGVLATPRNEDGATGVMHWGAGAKAVPHIDTMSAGPLSVSRLGHTLLAGGSALHVEKRVVAGQEVKLASIGAPPKDGDIEAVMVQSLTEAREVFVADTAQPYTVLKVWLPFAAGVTSDPFAASASERALLMYGNPNRPAEWFRDHLLHESLHYWFPGMMGRRTAYVNSDNWISEGLNNGVTDRLLVRYGHLSLEAYVDKLNGVLADYAKNPARKYSKAQLDADKSVPASKLPYVQGQLAAVVLDAAIRQVAADQSIETVIGKTVAAHRKAGQTDPLAPAERIALAMREVGVKEATAVVAQMATSGRRLVIPANAFGDCASVSQPASAEDDSPQVVALRDHLDEAGRTRCARSIGGLRL